MAIPTGAESFSDDEAAVVKENDPALLAPHCGGQVRQGTSHLVSMQLDGQHRCLTRAWGMLQNRRRQQLVGRFLCTRDGTLADGWGPEWAAEELLRWTRAELL